MIAVLDGQQRLTAFNIGLRGSMSVKLPYRRWKSNDAFPQRFLALNLLAPNERDEDGNRFVFDFVSQNSIGRSDKQLWFRVGDILSMEGGPQMNDWLIQQKMEGADHSRAFHVLDRLFRVVHTDPTIAYYEERNQDIEHVLSIFIRRNSGGTTLSYSDLLLSIATSQWTLLDARKEVHQLVDDLNRIGPGLGLTKDFVLKAGLMLTDIASVGFQVRNFTQKNMAKLEENWQTIRDTLIETVQLVTGFGFDESSIRATSALHPIAYYLSCIGTPSDFDSSTKYHRDREKIRGWLTRSILKASGIWGSGLDTLLTVLRDAIRENHDHGFPSDRLQSVMALRGKSLEFSTEEIEDLADIGYSDRRAFGLLSLLSPFIDLQKNKFHIDHVFPKSRFDLRSLAKAGIKAEQLEEHRDCANRLGNLQLLEGVANLEKRARLPLEWLEESRPDPDQRRQYCENYLLSDIPEDVTGFLKFYEMRRSRLQERISNLVNVV